jgi:hypothetical protein
MSNLTVIIRKNFLKSAIKRQEMKIMATKLSGTLEQDLLRHNLRPPFVFEVV